MSIKSSKKGLTLIELVVTIAILAVVAAVAFPSVVGIISDAAGIATDANASALDIACKDLYTGVTSGTITKTNAGALAANKLPATCDALSTKQRMAKKLTVNDALTYSGLRLNNSLPNAENISEFQYNTKDGKVTRINDDGTVQAGCVQMNLGVKLGDMYKNV